MVRTVEGHHYNQRSPSEQEEALSVDDHQLLVEDLQLQWVYLQHRLFLDYKGTIMKRMTINKISVTAKEQPFKVCNFCLIFQPQSTTLTNPMTTAVYIFLKCTW